MPQAVVFDLFETLVTEYDPNWTHAQSIPSQLAVPDTLFTTAWAAMRRRRMLGQGPDTATALRMICDSAGVQADAAVIDRLTIHRKKAKAEPIMRPEPAILNMLDELLDLGIKLALLSNAAPDEVEAWQESPLAQRVGCATFSFQVQLAKPDPMAFCLACERLGVDPGRSVFVGDGGDSELSGASEAGMEPCWATWFLDRWPSWKLQAVQAQGAENFPRLKMPNELVERLRLADR